MVNLNRKKLTKIFLFLCIPLELIGGFLLIYGQVSLSWTIIIIGFVIFMIPWIIMVITE